MKTWNEPFNNPYDQHDIVGQNSHAKKKFKRMADKYYVVGLYLAVDY